MAPSKSCESLLGINGGCGRATGSPVQRYDYFGNFSYLTDIKIICVIVSRTQSASKMHRDFFIDCQETKYLLMLKQASVVSVDDLARKVNKR